ARRACTSSTSTPRAPPVTTPTSSAASSPRPPSASRSRAACARRSRSRNGSQSGRAQWSWGTAAVREPGMLSYCAERHGGQVYAALDIRNGKAAVEGWVETESTDVEVLIHRWNMLPLAGVVVTATERDGTLGGPDIDALRHVKALCKHPIQYSGGVGSLEDLRAVREADAAAVILGRSLYEGRISLEEALAL